MEWVEGHIRFGTGSEVWLDLVVGEVLEQVLSVVRGYGVLGGHILRCELLWVRPPGIEDVHGLFGCQVALLWFLHMEIVFYFHRAILWQLVLPQWSFMGRQIFVVFLKRSKCGMRVCV